MQGSVHHHHILPFPLASCLHISSYTETHLPGALDLIKKDRILKLPLMPIHSHQWLFHTRASSGRPEIKIKRVQAEELGYFKQLPLTIIKMLAN